MQNDLATISPRPTPSWNIPAFNSSRFLTGLTVLAKYGICPTGFIFTYSDGSTEQTGLAGDISLTMYLQISNSYTTQLLVRRHQTATPVISLILICRGAFVDDEGYQCIEAGDTTQNTGNAQEVQNNDVITSFYGSYAYYPNADILCLTLFGVDYYKV